MWHFVMSRFFGTFFGTFGLKRKQIGAEREDALGDLGNVCASRCRKPPYLRPSRHMLSQIAATGPPSLMPLLSEAAPLETLDTTWLASLNKIFITGNFMPFRLSRHRMTAS
jgi:hypothetical protein